MKRPRHFKFIVTVIIILGIVAALLAVAQDQITLKIESAYAADDPMYPGYVAALLGPHPTGGNPYTVLTNGDQIFPSMLEAVNGATRRISFETYIYNKGTVGQQFTEAFIEAAKRGVLVQLVIDAMGSNKIPKEWHDSLKAAGVKLGEFGKAKWYSLEELNYRTHRKILVVDGRGRVHRRRRARRPVAGERAGQGALARHDGAHRGPGRPVDGRGVLRELRRDARAGDADRRSARADAGRARRTAPSSLRSSPTGGGNDLKRLYLLTIAAARRTLDITTPYFVTDESSDWALEEAVRRGVKSPHSRRRGSHRRDAGEVRQPPRLRALHGARASRSTSTSRR